MIWYYEIKSAIEQDLFSKKSAFSLRHEFDGVIGAKPPIFRLDQMEGLFVNSQCDLLVVATSRTNQKTSPSNGQSTTRTTRARKVCRNTASANFVSIDDQYQGISTATDASSGMMGGMASHFDVTIAVPHAHTTSLRADDVHGLLRATLVFSSCIRLATERLQAWDETNSQSVTQSSRQREDEHLQTQCILLFVAQLVKDAYHWCLGETIRTIYFLNINGRVDASLTICSFQKPFRVVEYQNDCVFEESFVFSQKVSAYAPLNARARLYHFAVHLETANSGQDMQSLLHETVLGVETTNNVHFNNIVKMFAVDNQICW